MRKWIWSGVVIVGLLTWSRIRLVNSLPDQGYFAKYSIVADQILAGHIPRDRLLDFSPLYLWFVVGLRALGIGLRGIRPLQIILVSGAALLVAIVARRFGAIALFAAPIFVLGSRAALVCATDLEPETLILILNAGALACIVEDSRPRLSGQRRPVVLHFLGGLLLGFSAACRPVAVLVAIGLAIVCRSWRILAGTFVPIIVLLIVNVSMTGELTLMDPGTVFYEGMNPSASGYEGVQPRIITELERQSDDPDYLHVAYRLVASRALGRPVTRAESNRYWTGKALAFVRAYPSAALRLVAKKFYFALHSYDAYDLATMVRKNFLLARFPFIPFGVMVALAIVALLLHVRGIAPFVVFAAAIGITLVVFYVTARQREAMIPSMAVLASAGVAVIVERNQIFPAMIAIVIAVLLTIDGNAQREDAAGWSVLRNPFERAVALEQGGRWGEADALLGQLGDYRPIQENRAVSSIAYYRAVAAAHLGRDPRPFLVRAEEEAPGNEHVLAWEAALGDARAEKRLFALHDPFTARRSLLAARQQGM